MLLYGGARTKGEREAVVKRPSLSATRAHEDEERKEDHVIYL
jgi:hypothetical protein